MALLHYSDLWLSQINAEKIPRAFSYVSKEDASVHEVLTASRLSENFFPLSPKAMAELRLLQEQTISMQLTMNTHDTWTCAWGSDTYSSRLYYKLCFREITPTVILSGSRSPNVLPS
jgi:hypothetical protein